MSFYEKHKSHEKNKSFGIVIENNTGKDTYIDFLGYKEMGRVREEGINIYPLYQDLHFSSIWELSNWIMASGVIAVDVTKFQSSNTFETKREYLFIIQECDASGQMVSLPCKLHTQDDLPLHTAQANYEFRMSQNTSFGYSVEKYSHIIIKFYPNNNQKNFTDGFYSKLKTEYKNFNEEKKKRLTILI